MSRMLALLCDSVMCAAMNALQRRRRHEAVSREEMEAFWREWAGAPRGVFFEAPTARLPAARPGMETWPTPWPGREAENNQAHAYFWLGAGGARTPTVLIFHALMSASDWGYRRVARWFHRRGWNAVFLQLPYHYQRTPRGAWNGELAITSHLVRNGAALRQGVAEARQILAALRRAGCRRFGLLGTSYGGWVAGLVASLETDLVFTALLQPVADPAEAIWNNPAARELRRQVEARGISRALVERHAPLASLLAAAPGSGSSYLALGTYDRVTPPALLRRLAEAWPGTQVIEVRQGHFGYQALRQILKALDESGVLCG